MLSQALKPLIFFSSSQALISLRRRRCPSRCRRRRQPTPVASPLQVSALSSFLVNFLNCCFGLIFLDLVLFCGEKWCCPYVILGKI